MSKNKYRKLATIPILIGILLIILLSIFGNMNAMNTPQENNTQNIQDTQETQETENQDNIDQKPERPELVIPENPIGTLGLMFASIISLGLFLTTRKKLWPKL